jgi:hypothetical protein
MIRKTLLAIAVGAAAVLFVPAAANAATAADVDGLWTSIDVDGSHQAMEVVSVGSGFGVILFDDNATMCGGGFALAFGPATLAGDTLSAHLNVFCFNHHPLAPVTDNFVFDAATTSLVDSGTAVWTRP